MPSLILTRDSGVGIITLDVVDAPVNTLSLGLAEELRAMLDDIERDTSIGAVVLISGKADNFIAGADIEQFLEFKTSRKPSKRVTRTKSFSAGSSGCVFPSSSRSTARASALDSRRRSPARGASRPSTRRQSWACRKFNSG
jgi:hypothetical protein